VPEVPVLPMRERPVEIALNHPVVEAERTTTPSPQAEAPVAADAGLDILARAAVGGDVSAVGHLYDQLLTPIYRYIAVRVRSREDAEDLTQLVFERIVSSLPRYRSRGRPFEAWAFRIARNAVIDHVRRDRAHEPLGDSHDSGHNETPDRLTVRGEEIRELRSAIRLLTADQQEALALRFAAGLSAEEAAEVMGKRAGTVRGLTFRAIASLRRLLLPEEGQVGR
jgi:RNA polymerase sigma-70 factor (ECF subfamily)